MLSVRDEIRNRIAELAHAGDLGEAVAAARVYTEDGSFRTEGFPRHIANDSQMTGRAAIEAGYRGLFETNAGQSRHWVGNVWFRSPETDETQVVHSYFAILRVGLAPIPGILMTGMYEDEFVRTQGTWALKTRVCVVDPRPEHRTLAPSDVLITRFDNAQALT